MSTCYHSWGPFNVTAGYDPVLCRYFLVIEQKTGSDELELVWSNLDHEETDSWSVSQFMHLADEFIGDRLMFSNPEQRAARRAFWQAVSDREDFGRQEDSP